MICTTTTASAAAAAAAVTTVINIYSCRIHFRQGCTCYQQAFLWPSDQCSLRLTECTGYSLAAPVV